MLVNVREAHPGAATPQPADADQKRAHAERLRDLHKIPYEVAVDDIDDELHRALRPKPNSAYLLGTDGTILFRAHWANETKAIAEALDAVTAGRPLRRMVSRGMIRPMWTDPALCGANPGPVRTGCVARHVAGCPPPPPPPPPMEMLAYLLRLLRLVHKGA